MKDKRGGNIGRLLVLEFNEEETDVFDEVMEVVDRHPDFKKYELRDEPALHDQHQRNLVWRLPQEPAAFG